MSDSKLRVIISAQLREFERAMTRAEKQLEKFGDTANKIGATMSVSLTAPIVAAGAKAIKAAANFEKLQTQLNVLEGSAEKGAKSFQRLVKFSAKTPFQLDQLVKANNTLRGFGISTEVAFQSLKAIGDIAAVSGGDMQGITVAFAQSAASGRLMAQDLNQLVNNGVPIIELLAKSLKVATNEIKDMASEGKITFPVLLKAFKDATSEGGQFNGGMETLSKTLNGVASTLQDNVNIAFAELGKTIVEDFDLVGTTEELTDNVKYLTDKFKELNPELRKTITSVVGIGAALGPLFLAIGSFAKYLAPLFIKGFKTVSKAVRGLLNVLLTLEGAFVAIFAAITAAFQKVLNEVIDPTIEFFEAAKLLLMGIGARQAYILELNKKMNALKVEATPYAALDESAKKAKDSVEELAKSILMVKLPFGRNDKVNLPTPRVAMPTERDLGLDEMAFDAQEANKNLDEMFRTDPQLQYALAQTAAYQEYFANATKKAYEELMKEAQAMENAKTLFDEMSALLSQAGAEAVTGIGEALGKAMMGMGGFAEGMKNVVGGAFAQLLIDVGKAAIKIGTAIAGIKEALKSLNPAVAVAAGVALVALGTYFKGRMEASADKIKAFANGGIISGPTLGLMGEYAGAKSNPEVVAPLDRLKNLIGGSQGNVNVSGEFRVQGQDLVVALERANKQRGNFL